MPEFLGSFSVAAPAAMQYRLFGLTVGSELPSNWLDTVTADAAPSLSISYGAVPRGLPHGTRPCLFTEVAQGACLHEIPGHGRLFITSEHIRLEKHPAGDDNLLHAYLFRYAMAIVMQLRGCLVLRGAAVALGERGIAIAGVPTAGASVLAAELVGRGGKLVSDDLCVIHFDAAGRPLLLPSHPVISLWQDMADRAGSFARNLGKLRQQLEKFAFAAYEPHCQPEPILLDDVIALEAHNRKDVSIAPVAGSKKVAQLYRLSFQHGLLAGLGLKPQHYRACVAIAKQCRLSTLVRPSKADSRADLAALVEACR